MKRKCIIAGCAFFLVATLSAYQSQGSKASDSTNVADTDTVAVEAAPEVVEPKVTPEQISARVNEIYTQELSRNSSAINTSKELRDLETKIEKTLRKNR